MVRLQNTTIIKVIFSFNFSKSTVDTVGYGLVASVQFHGLLDGLHDYSVFVLSRFDVRVIAQLLHFLVRNSPRYRTQYADGTGFCFLHPTIHLMHYHSSCRHTTTLSFTVLYRSTFYKFCLFIYFFN